eukprot:5910411-Amphidinium_carterae.1
METQHHCKKMFKLPSNLHPNAVDGAEDRPDKVVLDDLVGPPCPSWICRLIAAIHHALLYSDLTSSHVLQLLSCTPMVLEA